MNGDREVLIHAIVSVCAIFGTCYLATIHRIAGQDVLGLFGLSLGYMTTAPTISRIMKRPPRVMRLADAVKVASQTVSGPSENNT